MVGYPCQSKSLPVKPGSLLYTRLTWKKKKLSTTCLKHTGKSTNLSFCMLDYWSHMLPYQNKQTVSLTQDTNEKTGAWGRTKPFTPAGDFVPPMKSNHYVRIVAEPFTWYKLSRTTHYITWQYYPDLCRKIKRRMTHTRSSLLTDITRM